MICKIWKKKTICTEWVKIGVKFGAVADRIRLFECHQLYSILNINHSSVSKCHFSKMKKYYVKKCKFKGLFKKNYVHFWLYLPILLNGNFGESGHTTSGKCGQDHDNCGNHCNPIGIANGAITGIANWK
jgi:hypothetical protein